MQIVLIPMLKDNYSYLIIDQKSRETLVIDPSEANPIINYLTDHKLKLKYILNTHHHNDHIQGNKSLSTLTNAPVLCSYHDINHIETCKINVSDNEIFDFGFTKAQILEIPGHTLGHIAFYFPELDSLFCGDTLFFLGCGRVFDGSYEQLFISLQRIASLPDNTYIYCGHEYTLNNAKFALSVDRNNPFLQNLYLEILSKCQNKQPTIPSQIWQEKKANPFLRTDDIQIKKFLQMENYSKLEVFRALRELKNNF